MLSISHVSPFSQLPRMDKTCTRWWMICWIFSFQIWPMCLGWRATVHRCLFDFVWLPNTSPKFRWSNLFSMSLHFLLSWSFMAGMMILHQVLMDGSKEIKILDQLSLELKQGEQLRTYAGHRRAYNWLHKILRSKAVDFEISFWAHLWFNHSVGGTRTQR